MENKIIFVDNKYFKIVNILKLSNSYNLLGFYSKDKKTWFEHVSSITVSESEYFALIKQLF